jgi:endonuclease/exonuclease/phosphatase family metal-dependent hydrolase
MPHEGAARGPVIVLGVCALTWAACTPLPNYLRESGPVFIGAFSSSRPVDTSTRLKITTLNVHFAEQMSLIIRTLEEPQLRDSDALLLQEADEDGTREVARRLQYDYVYYPASVHIKGKNFGNAVLARCRLSDPRKRVLPHAGPANAQRRIVVGATAHFSGGAVFLCSAHLETISLVPPSKRVDQAKAVVDFVTENTSPGGTALVGGDLNSVLGGARILKAFDDAGFTHTSHGVEGTARLGPFRFTLDHIFARGFDVRASGKVATSGSDHCAVWATLTR